MTSSLRRASADQLADRLLQGDRLALSRLMTLIESGREDARAALSTLYAHTGRAHVVGVTGPPGSGKSTLTTRLAVEERQRGRQVGIVAVDPTSPFTGGALLGDRIRMMELHSDPGVFVRSLATRGMMGGLSRATMDVVSLLDAYGMEIILLETVGVGQDEVEIARAADTTLVVGVPGLGDDIQAIKAGILEIADIFVVNKADLERAHQLVVDLRTMIGLGPKRDWPPPILETVATTGKGIPELADQIEQHRAYLERSGTWHRRRAEIARRQVQAIVEDRVRQRVEHLLAADNWPERFEAIATRQQDPYSVADEVLREISNHCP